MTQRWMLSDETYEKLVSNFRLNEKLTGSRGEIDLIPACKLFNPTGVGTWLITELDPDTGLAFGLADMGRPELGYISMDELAEFKGLAGLGIEEDASFETALRLSKWADDARRVGAIRA